MPLSSQDLAAWTDGFWQGSPPKEVPSLQFDTRRLGGGELFVALTEGERDGHGFLRDAMRLGASAAMVEHCDSSTPLPQLCVKDTLLAWHQIARAHRERFDYSVIAVTGSFGKTSTKEMLRAIIPKSYASFKNFNNRIGVPYNITQMDTHGHLACVIEAGMNLSGEMAQLAETICPDIAIVTNVEAHHLAGVGTVEDVAFEKFQLARHLKPGGLLICPAKCFKHAAFKELDVRVKAVAPVGEDTPVSDIVRYSLQDRSIEIEKRGGSAVSFSLPSMTSGMMSNAALSIVAAWELGTSDEVIQAGLLSWRPQEHRGQVWQRGEQRFYVDSYNAGLVSMQDALAHFDKTFSGKERLYVLGAMHELGGSSYDSHKELGATLQLRKNDRVVLIGEEAKQILNGVEDRAAVSCLEKTEDAKDLVAAFEGAIFLKGSKPYRLHELLPQGAILEKDIC